MCRFLRALHEYLHPETRHGGAPGKAGGGKVAKEDRLSSFDADTAERTGKDPRTIRRDAERGEKIAENLHRAELTALERDEQVVEYARLAGEREKLSHSATVSAGGRGKKGGDRQAARDLGLDKDDVHRAGKVAGLSPEAKAAAVEERLGAECVQDLHTLPRSVLYELAAPSTSDEVR